VWSYQEARQILARAHRQPQKKIVKAIHILAGDSSDILLNSIALRKREMFDVFVSKELNKGKIFLFLCQLDDNT
jgi:TATA-binding protein-associated factor